MTLKERIAYYSLGFVGEQYLPSIGLHAIKENYSTENFLILAGMSDKDNPASIKRIFFKSHRRKQNNYSAKVNCCSNYCKVANETHPLNKHRHY
jgi:hypothetical protein